MIEITIGKTLNPELWDGMKLDPEVRRKLIEIAIHFAEYLDIPEESVKDVTFTGSMANFHYGPKSDIDLHIVLDYKDIDDNVDLVKKMLRAKKALYNDRHDIKIKDREVELYPQDASEPHYSTAVYSIKNGNWITRPTPVYVDIDKNLIRRKAEDLIDRAKLIMNTEDLYDKVERLEKFKDKIMDMRKAGLEKGGEFSTENLVFKELRNNGFLEALLYEINNSIDKSLSLDEMEKYQRQSIKINKINIPILLGLKGGGKAFRPRKKNKKMKPYIHQPKPNYLSAPPGAPGGLEESETIYKKSELKTSEESKMAIIVEIKSKRNRCIGCAKEPTLQELQEGILGDLGSGIMNMISGKGTGFTKAIAAEIQAYVVDAILQSLFDVAKNPEVRDTIVFKTFKQTLASIDLEDIKQIYTNKRSWCAETAENLLVALLRVTTSEVEEEISYFASQKADQLAGSKIGAVLGGLAKLGTSSTEFLAKMTLEDFKSSGAFEQITDGICSIKFTDVIKQVPGVGSIIGAFSEE